MGPKPRRQVDERILASNVVPLRRGLGCCTDMAASMTVDLPDVVELAKQPGILSRLHAVLHDLPDARRATRLSVAR